MDNSTLDKNYCSSSGNYCTECCSDSCVLDTIFKKEDKQGIDYAKIIILFLGLLLHFTGSSFLEYDSSLWGDDSLWLMDLLSFISACLVIIYLILALFHRFTLNGMNMIKNTLIYSALLISIFFVVYGNIQKTLAEEQEWQCKEALYESEILKQESEYKLLKALVSWRIVKELILNSKEVGNYLTISIPSVPLR